MEAVGSRLGRASSRYGAPTVFSGPVRKWKKKWVHVSRPSVNYHHSQSHTNNQNNSSSGSRLLLCRWTPITASTTAAADTENSTVSDEPPKRKFRYTPIAVLEEQKKMVIRKSEYEAAIETDQLKAGPRNESHEMRVKLDINEIVEKETQDSKINQLDLGLGLKGSSGENNQSIEMSKF